MDYEKKYKALVEAVKMLKEANPSDDGIQNWVKDNVPELKESEDERIRKALKEYFINSFQNNGVAAICGMHIKDILTWLEGEQKPVYLKTKAGNWYICDMEVMNENMKTAFHRDEIYYCPKDGYLDVGGALFEVGCLDAFRLATEKEIPQPKHEWNEEDKKIIGNIRRIIEQYAFSQSAVDVNGELCEKEYIDADNWLKSLKDRVQPQPKQEWSEEDEKKLRGICNYISCSDSPEGFEEWIDWLKSLRPQSTWKPTDLQLECLSDAIISYNRKGYPASVLKELLEQLKNLTE